MNITATYSPDDNKLRLYASHRLDAETFERVKAAGFRWAPKQDLFFAPMWTPARAALCIELAGQIDDEDASLIERAEERADRFEGYSENRARDSEAARRGVEAIGQRFEFGQPILIGHHSERRARKDAERMDNGMRKAVKAFETSQYWERRAAGAIAHAKYKERPDVRARRIKTIEAEARSIERDRAKAEAQMSAWSAPGLTLEAARLLADVYYCHAIPRSPEHPHGRTAYDVLRNDPPDMTVEAVAEIMRRNAAAAIGHCVLWAEHYAGRLTYERAMLIETGGAVAEFVTGEREIQVGGRVRIRGEWLTVVRVNKKDGRAVSITTNARYVRVRGLEEVKEYEPPAEGAAEAVAAATKPPPLCNYPSAEGVEMTSAEWKKIHESAKCIRKTKGTETAGPHRYRVVMRGYRQAVVYLTDAKRIDPPAPNGDGPRPTLPAPAVAAAMVLQREPREPSQADRAAECIAAMREAIKAGTPQVVAVPQLFPTPPEVARRMIEAADIRHGMRVLEPSAGTGNLLAALPDGCEVVAVEIHPLLAQRLRVDFKAAVVHTADFLAVDSRAPGADPEALGRFDRIVMNPPFSGAEDIAHIEHATQFLKPGGRLVALCANGSRQNDKLRPLVEAVGGTWEELPPGSFQSSGTGVRVVMLTIDIPADRDTRAGHTAALFA